ncbi:MAG: glycine cleavage system protein H [Phycisphaeraceae bacterium]
MDCTPDDVVRYKRSRFSTRLPEHRLYTASHSWLWEREPGLWRVGYTKFATRMLGELVEHDFEVKPGDAVKVGQIIGWVEGFKAASDVYCVLDGEFVTGNPALTANVALLDEDTYGEGWLYEIRGKPEPGAMDVQGYTGILDLAIDKIQGKQESGDRDQESEGNE